MRTLRDLDPTEFRKSVQHIPSFLVKRTDSVRLIEQRVAPNAMAADAILEELLQDDTVEGVQPGCLHVCLN